MSGGVSFTRTDPGLEAGADLPTCAQGFHPAPVSGGLLGNVAFFGHSGLLLGALVHMGSAGVAGIYPSHWVQFLGYIEMCLLLDTPFGRSSAGALSL